ncbi:sulfotransferase domain-containing protein [Brumicola nitratireducens]|uniref:Sulfotransferase domain-containing protein n=1 Tax=Glaciecola nitratireducens (strain JCM 12485 / KCTC 12276 / FR1064) TaxID=1085623 RepID=G4QIP0_GLANF|nr:sulfotransferase domain-containing protein [Glaciecola nitratireducens]AEP31195.1 hypothetical protein GNIT_3100 [Glaciecola nitratireducens FR1064]
MKYLITGIPRSGTTLCCHILNQQNNIVALHEPINPSQLNLNSSNVVKVVSQKYNDFQQALYQGTEFEHGDNAGLEIDNPVGLSVVKGKREVIAKRGKIKVPKYIGKDIQLFIKQNALFTAFLSELSEHFNVTCIVRNPVDVLLSWWTVNLPVSKGSLPAGENNDASLKQVLSSQKDELQRQLIIYQWFARQFVAANSTIIRYEDIIKTNGQALFNAANVVQTKPLSLEAKTRVYSDDIILKLKHQQNAIMQMDCFGLYSQDEIVQSIEAILA